MPFIIVALLGFGGVLYGADQHDQRRREQRNLRARLEQLQTKLLLSELELAGLSALLGEKNMQVKQLAAKVEQLRALNAEWRKWVV